MDELCQRQRINLFSRGLARHHCKDPVDDTDALLSELRADILSVQMEELREESVGTELVEFVAHSLVKLLLLCLKLGDSLFEKLVLTVLFL